MTGASGQWQQLCVARGAKFCNRRVQSLAEPERPVTHPGNNTCLRADQTRLADKVALWNLSRQQPDAGTVASGCGMERVRSNSETRSIDLLTIGVQVTVGITWMTLNIGQHMDGYE
jgi:hypothetical protein